jgi:hypothetical protein
VHFALGPTTLPASCIQRRPPCQGDERWSPRPSVTLYAVCGCVCCVCELSVTVSGRPFGVYQTGRHVNALCLCCCCCWPVILQGSSVDVLRSNTGEAETQANSTCTHRHAITPVCAPSFLSLRRSARPLAQTRPANRSSVSGVRGSSSAPSPSVLCVLCTVRFLHLIRPVMCVLPEVSSPENKVSGTDRQTDGTAQTGQSTTLQADRGRLCNGIRMH